MRDIESPRARRPQLFRLLYSGYEVASVDGKYNSGDERSGIGSKEGGRFTDFLRRSVPAHGRPREDTFAEDLVGFKRRQQWRVDPAGGDGVDPDSVGSVGLGE